MNSLNVPVPGIFLFKSAIIFELFIRVCVYFLYMRANEPRNYFVFFLFLFCNEAEIVDNFLRKQIK